MVSTFRIGAAVCWSKAAEPDLISRDGSHYSLASGMLPSLGAKSHRSVHLGPLIISPYAHKYRFVIFQSLRTSLSVILATIYLVQIL
jgi:hypothetical protein